MKYLITGAAGFIGFHLSLNLLRNKKNIVYGLDNFDSYYSVKLKKKRAELLSKYKNFKLIKVNLTKKSQLKKLQKIKVNIIFHLAAQAGVRYTLINPDKYVETNIFGYYNLLSYIQNSRAKYIFYASSSSIYGDNKNYPLNEKAKLLPKNIYAYSKISNENCSRLFSKLFKKKFIGLRFFTVYGEWGRPDMFMMKYLASSYDKKINFYLNNYGKHTRDFTYILDACKIISKLVFTKKKINHEIFNICSNNPKKLTDVIKKINFLTQKKPKLFKRKLQQADVVKTHGTNKKIKSFIGNQSFTSLDDGLKITVEWFKHYYKI